MSDRPHDIPRKTKPLGIMCVRVSSDDRAILTALAALTRESLSSVVRDLMRDGARQRLRLLGNGSPQKADT